MWDIIKLPEKRLPDREYNLKSCGYCAQCRECGGLRTERVDCVTCVDCFIEAEIEGDPFPIDNLPCTYCLGCDADTKYKDCKGCTECTQCELNLD